MQACPSSTLKRLGLPYQNYKQPQGGPLSSKRRRTRRVILDHLSKQVSISPEHRRVMMRNGGGDASRRDSRRNDGNGDGPSALRRCYLDVTEFVLSHVRDVYERHGVRWSAGAFASITATLFIAETKPEFWRQGYGSQATREGP